MPLLTLNTLNSRLSYLINIVNIGSFVLLRAKPQVDGINLLLVLLLLEVDSSILQGGLRFIKQALHPDSGPGAQKKTFKRSTRQHALHPWVHPTVT